MTDSRTSVDSPQGDAGDRRSVQIQEDPDSKAQLEALFEVGRRSANKGGKPMIERTGLPDSFFNPNLASQNKFKHRLGPSISVGPTVGSSPYHSRSISLPVGIDRRQYSDSTMQLPAGWEIARTPDGLGYFIE